MLAPEKKLILLGVISELNLHHNLICSCSIDWAYDMVREVRASQCSDLEVLL
jgi:hypothetical protein